MIFFFFQAEDGIRDTSVTGVQTCALPICLCHDEASRAVITMTNSAVASVATITDRMLTSSIRASRPATTMAVMMIWRSEERRVGKECRAGGGREDCRERSADEREE